MTRSSRTTTRPPSPEGRWPRDTGHGRPALDWAYLERQTFGDRALQRALLSLFIENAALLLARIEATRTLAHRHDLVHTLRGSAMAVGAHGVADAAADLENAPALPETAQSHEDAYRPLRTALAEARAAIVAGVAS